MGDSKAKQTNTSLKTFRVDHFQYSLGVFVACEQNIQPRV